MKILPNQYGTFGNRVNFHDISSENAEKIFVVEFHTEDIQLRQEIIAKIRAMDDVLEALQKVYRLAKQIGLAEDLDFEESDYIGSAINEATTL